MANKQYDVVRDFRLTDPRDGTDTHYKVGDTYSGSTDNPHLLHPKGPDGKGPLIAEKSSSSSSSSSGSSSDKSDSSSDKSSSSSSSATNSSTKESK